MGVGGKSTSTRGFTISWWGPAWLLVFFAVTPLGAGQLKETSTPFPGQSDGKVGNTGAATSCPCSIWSSATAPGQADVGDAQAVELGVKFRSDVDGFITAIRFYKGPANTGMHVAHLWSATGSVMASAAFAEESSSGWQEAKFTEPVRIKADTIYVASYYASLGHYSADNQYFRRGFDNPPLHAAFGSNGVFSYGASAFPTSSFESTNYWVDVVFDTAAPAPGEAGVEQGEGEAGQESPVATPAQSGEVKNPVQAASCPCSIWSPAAAPGRADASDGRPVELGVKFRSEIDGAVTGIRFYKGVTNTGAHVAHLWSGTGLLLASATFAGESSSGWQEVKFEEPVRIKAGTIYVASYHAPLGHYSADNQYFGNGIDNPPLHAVPGLNGVFSYGVSAFPTTNFESTNYWVDLVFDFNAGPLTPPSVTSVWPPDGAAPVPIGAQVRATFSEPMDPKTISASSFVLRDISQRVVPSVVTYNAMAATATLAPMKELAPSSVYGVTVSAQPATVPAKLDAGAAVASRTWSFTTGTPPTEGPGGPILVVADASNPFSRYYAEILRAEGLNEFSVRDIEALSSATLEGYDVIILGEFPLSGAQAEMFSAWVESGGSLIAMRPDKRLVSLLGLTKASGTLTNGYLLADPSTAVGKGIVNQTVQFHGTADLYALSGASSLATLCADAATATSSPAVTLRKVGSHGGQAAGFTYDLARSVVYTRQGNPAWSGQERDGVPPIRSDDLFFGAARGHPQPDWVDLSKVEIPQADEQQRLLANLIIKMNLAKKPLPRFWYFPRMLKAVVVMTGDDHGHGGTAGRFDKYVAASPAGCSLDKWECVRGTAYIYPSTPLSDSQAASYTALGFEIGLHLRTGSGCQNFTSESLGTAFTQQLGEWASLYKELPSPSTERNHCIPWSDYDTQPQIELKHGIRFDTNYYYWPAPWVRDRPGLFTGSGMPLRFTERDGAMLDVYQATTQMTDESGQSYPHTIDRLLDNAIGPLGYYGAFTANIHNDSPASRASDAIVSSAQARGVPVVSSIQMLRWLDARNSSSFNSLSWSGNTLSFNVSVAEGANGLQAMIPLNSETEKLTDLGCDGKPVAHTTETIKGMTYVVFAAASAACRATYSEPLPSPSP